MNSRPVDQAAFTRLMLVTIEPRMTRPDQPGEVPVQLTNKDGTERKWTAQVVASMPSRWDADRSESEVLSITVTCADDPTSRVHEGDMVEFANWTTGVMDPEMNASGRIRGGRLFDQATGIRTKVVAAHRAKADG